jgi:hypothetical protein
MIEREKKKTVFIFYYCSSSLPQSHDQYRQRREKRINDGTTPNYYRRDSAANCLVQRDIR